METVIETRIDKGAPMETFLTVSEAALRLGVSESVIRRYADSGLLACVRLPGRGDRRLAETSVMRLRHEIYGETIDEKTETKAQ